MLQIETNLMAIIISTLAIVAAGCTSQMESDEYSMARPSCPRNMILQCFKRTAQPAVCRCVTQGDLEETIESIIGSDPH